MCDILIASKLQANQTHSNIVNFLSSYSKTGLRNVKSLITLPPLSPSLQITEASFMGGTYSALIP